MRHVVLVEGSAGSVPAPSLISSLPHPRTSGPREYLLEGGRILEFTRVGSPVTCPSSWFLDQHVKSDGSLLTATAVDPLFFLLPILEASGARFQPLHQCLSSYPSGDCRALLGVRDLHSRLAVVSEQKAGLTADVDDVLVRLDRTKAVAALAAKVLRLARALQEEADSLRARTRAAMEGSFQVGTTSEAAPSSSSSSSSSSPAPAEGQEGASSSSSSSSSAAGSPSAAAPAPLQSAHVEAALGLVSEYLADSWLPELTQRVSGAAPAATPEQAAPEVSRAAAWNAAANHDPYTAISRYVQGQRVKEGGSGGKGGDSSGPVTKPSLAANKLAAAAKGKGVQSVASFFKKV
jgi:hypothetical protein